MLMAVFNPFILTQSNCMKLSITICILILTSIGATAQITLPRLISDSMILQRNIPVNIWGWASVGEKVSVTINKKVYRTKTGADGKWKLQLAAIRAGGPYTMQVRGKNTIVIHDIYFGDVWLCSGQSNMVHQMRIHNIIYADEIAKAGYPLIRHFAVPNITNLQSPQEKIPGGSWSGATPANVNEFSAVAYFFAKKLYEKYKVAIGLINASWGGTPIETWISEDGLRSFPSIIKTVEKNKDTAFVNSFNRNVKESFDKLAKPADKGIDEKWFETSFEAKDWRTIAIPGYWEDQGIKNLNGAVWYRREIDVPASMVNNTAKVFLGRIVDADELYVNGTKIGNTTYMYPQRRYAVPGGILKAGKNLFVIRVINNAGKGGFVPDKPYQLIAGNDTIDLTGYWKYKVGQVNCPQATLSPIAVHYQPTALYNAMLAPLINYSIKGFTWYQGESNAGRPEEYSTLQPAMINDWRNKWQQGKLPFIFVQLPGFMDYNYLPSDGGWATFREAQAKSLSVANTAMAVAIDLGEWNDIHPDRKKEVGQRLALAAEKIAYGENIVYAGPAYKSVSIEGNKIIAAFDNTGSGLKTSDGNPPEEFAIAGADKKFVWATAIIEGDKVILFNNDIAEPKYVRYAWADNPVNPNLINKEGLPAAPFRTDSADTSIKN